MAGIKDALRARVASRALVEARAPAPRAVGVGPGPRRGWACAKRGPAAVVRVALPSRARERLQSLAAAAVARALGGWRSFSARVAGSGPHVAPRVGASPPDDAYAFAPGRRLLGSTLWGATTPMMAPPATVLAPRAPPGVDAPLRAPPPSEALNATVKMASSPSSRRPIWVVTARSVGEATARDAAA